MTQPIPYTAHQSLTEAVWRAQAAEAIKVATHVTDASSKLLGALNGLPLEQLDCIRISPNGTQAQCNLKEGAWSMEWWEPLNEAFPGIQFPDWGTKQAMEWPIVAQGTDPNHFIKQGELYQEAIHTLKKWGVDNSTLSTQPVTQAQPPPSIPTSNPTPNTQASPQPITEHPPYSPLLTSLGEVTGYSEGGPKSWTIPSTPRHLQGMIAGGLLGAGTGYGIGYLGSHLLPERWDRKRVPRTLALLGGLGGMAPGIVGGILAAGNGNGFWDDSAFRGEPLVSETKTASKNPHSKSGTSKKPYKTSHFQAEVGCGQDAETVAPRTPDSITNSWKQAETGNRDLLEIVQAHGPVSASSFGDQLKPSSLIKDVTEDELLLLLKAGSGEPETESRQLSETVTKFGSGSGSLSILKDAYSSGIDTTSHPMSINSEGRGFGGRERCYYGTEATAASTPQLDKAGNWDECVSETETLSVPVPGTYSELIDAWTRGTYADTTNCYKAGSSGPIRIETDGLCVPVPGSELGVRLDPVLQSAIKQAFGGGGDEEPGMGTGYDVDLNAIPIPVDKLNYSLFTDPHIVGSVPLPVRAGISGVMEAAQWDRGRRGLSSAFVTPADIGRLAVGMGSGYAAGALAGKALGQFFGMPDETQGKLRQVGALTGIIKAIAPLLFGD